MLILFGIPIKSGTSDYDLSASKLLDRVKPLGDEFILVKHNAATNVGEC
jgi:hypothetical protein